ncbi:hypothetical protein [Enterobacter kobei]|uniref:tail fiber/spike domain-containing protein n=1 Tax=Enterobacter kobei TaxID=208224 RepID=UPI003D657269
MTTYATNNPISSVDPRDLYDNSENFDVLSLDQSKESWPDRLGKDRLTWHGMEERIKRAILNLGWNPVGTFQNGVIITSAIDIIQDGSTGVWYRWDDLQTLPKTVPADSTPDSTGGIGEGKWLAVDVSDVLRKELAEPTGAALIGTESGLTVQEALNSGKRSIESVHRKKKVFETNWVFPDYNQLLSFYGYSVLIPQGLAIDNMYYYVAYTSNTSNGANLWHWIAMYQRANGTYVGCFSLPNSNNLSYPESLYVRDVGGSKYIYTTINGNAVGYDITSLPSNLGQVTTSVFTKSGVSAFAPSKEGLACYLSDFQDLFVVQVDWSGNVLGLVTLNDAVQTLTGKPSPYTSTRTKVQSRIMSNGKLIMVGGAQFKSEDTNQNRLPAFAPSYIHVNGDGTLSDVYVYDPLGFLNKVAGVTTAHVVENEGVAQSPDGKVYSLWYYEIQSPYTLKIFIVEDNSTDKDSVDLSVDLQNVLLGGGYNKNIIRSYDNSRFNPYTGVSFSNCESVCELMRNCLIDGPLTLYVASTFYFNTTNTFPVPSGSKIVFTRINAGTVFMEVTSGAMCTTITSTGLGQLTFNKGQIGGNNTDPWFGTGDFAILGMGGLGVVATKRAGISQSVHHRFENANGVVGTIETTSNSTLYNTSSDLRLKNIIGEFEGLSIVRGIIEDGGAKEAEFKNDEGNHYPMLIAQSVYKYMPSAVSVGEDGIMRVDYSKLMPVVLKAIYELTKKTPL